MREADASMGVQVPASQSAPAGDQSVQTTGWILEILSGFVSVAVLVWAMRDALIQGRSTFAHDVLYWIYPWYQFSAESLLQGRLPWWNPFTHGGEPFYPLLAQMRFLDPTTFAVLFIGSLFTSDILTIFAWDRFVRGLVFVVGSYLLLRQWALHTLTRCSLFPILLFSSFFLSSLRQDAISGHFIWVPFIMLLMFRIVYSREYGWPNWLMLGGLGGLNWQSYFFAGTWVFLLLFLFGTMIFHRQLAVGLMRARGVAVKLSVTAAIVGAMLLPNLVLVAEQDRFVFPARMLDRSTKSGPPLGGSQYWEPGQHAEAEQALVMSYEHVRLTGTNSRFMDFFQLITPFGNKHASGKGWGEPSEAFMYFGLWVYAGALWGLLAGQHVLKRIWIVLIMGFGLLMLGPSGGLHQVLYYFYLPLWFVRHTHALVLFFSIALLYFYVLGGNSFLQESPGVRQVDSKLLQGIALIVMGAVSAPHIIQQILSGTIPREIWDGYFVFTSLALGQNLNVHFRVGPPTLVRIGQAVLLTAGLLIILRAVSHRWVETHLFRTATVSFLTFLVATRPLESLLRLATLTDHDWISPFKIGFVIIAGLLLGPWLLYVILRIPQSAVFGVLMGMHLCLATVFEPHKWLYLLFLFVVMGFPLALLMLCPWQSLKICRRVLSAGIFVFILIDLLFYLTLVQGLWSWQRPDSALGFRTSDKEPAWHDTRTLVTESSLNPNPYPQAIRYQELLTRTPTVFSSSIQNEGGLTMESFRSMTRDETTRMLIEKRRWNTFLMLKPYYLLINSEIPISALHEIMAIGKPLLQLKPEAIRVSDDDAIRLLQDLGDDCSVRLLEHTILVEDTLPHGEPRPQNCLGSEECGNTGAARTECRNAGSNTLEVNWKVNHYDYQTLHLSATLKENGYLYWADGYDRHWQAFVDDRPVPILRANLVAKAVPVPAGAHQVRFVYFPRLYAISSSMFLSMQVLVAAMSLVLWKWPSRRNLPPPC
jgi:hypothetical protein